MTSQLMRELPNIDMKIFQEALGKIQEQLAGKPEALDYFNTYWEKQSGTFLKTYSTINEQYKIQFRVYDLLETNKDKLQQIYEPILQKIQQFEKENQIISEQTKELEKLQKLQEKLSELKLKDKMPSVQAFAMFNDDY